MRSDLVAARLPKAPIWRRAVAFTLDFFCAWFAGSLVLGSGGMVQLLRSLLFLIAWLTLRVFLPYRNQGQSLGRWVFDIKVIDPKALRSADLLALLKREAYLGASALFVALGLSSWRLIREGWIVLLVLPLALDLGLAIADSLNQQSLHDRLAKTSVIQTSRGYSLDLKVKRLLAEVSRRVKK
ncbi:MULTISPECIES: RDD family protein [Trichocoleus]|uniref:RDD family protein n=1 Tax=Trichocoleus desertorum GB2-A4 TaxID=2933944 RepID=A0ABV0JER6_9CYAN|nr:RDD family protein [Trichocoleus sp. FACHB-46]MBD1864446.1 RDD family protein [Trichocoleus sp. FACHB-46]